MHILCTWPAFVLSTYFNSWAFALYAQSLGYAQSVEYDLKIWSLRLEDIVFGSMVLGSMHFLYKIERRTTDVAVTKLLTHSIYLKAISFYGLN